MRFNRYIIIRNAAILLLICNMLYWFFPFPPLLWRVGYVLLALYVIIFKEGNRLPCEKIVLLFVLFNLIHFFISFLWITPSTTQIGNILCAMLSLSLFAYLSQKGVMNDGAITIIGIVLTVVSVIQYNHYESVAIVTRELDEGQSITNNATMAFLAILPMLFIMKNDIQRWITLLVCIFYILMGAKRGNIVAAIIPVGLFVYCMLRNRRRSGLKMIIVLAVIFGIAVVTYRWVSNNDYLQHRIEQTEEGNSSGRDVIYANAWRAWYGSGNLSVYLLGYGFDGTIHHPIMNKYHAHNDWLEILVDYGLLGIFLYLLVFIIFALQVKKVNSIEMKFVLISSIIIWLSKSLYSMGFMEETLSLMMISMGTVLGRYKLINGTK